MNTKAILEKMNFSEHCPSCEALLVTVPGGSFCPHCGYESSEPDDEAVLAYRQVGWRSRMGARYWAVDDRPNDVFDEAA